MDHPYTPTKTRPAGDLAFFADFENASADFEVRTADGAYEVAPYSWMHFGVEGVAGRRPTFWVDHPDHVDERRRFVHSTDGREWSYFGDTDVGEEHYEFAPAEPVDSDRLFVAGLFPYRRSDLEGLLASLRESPFVRRVGPRGHSPGRRPIYGLEITDPSVSESEKEHVVCLAGQHAWEAWGRHVMHGFLEAAVADDAAARRLRQRAVVHAYPIVNPDRIALGHMRDGTVDYNPNRAWTFGAPPGSEPAPVPEIDILRRAIVAETGGKTTYFLDFHSHAGQYDRFMFYANGDDPAVRELVEAVSRADDKGEGGLVGTECVGGSGSERRTST